MESENVETARKGYEAFRRKGVEGILEYLHPEIEWRAWSQFAREPNLTRGRDGVRRLFTLYGEHFDNLRAEPHEFIEAGDDRVVVPFRLVGTEKGTGREVAWELVHVWTADDGQARQLEVYESKADALRAVGLNDTD
jgi:ketosteroid isomerase-like protein